MNVVLTVALAAAAAGTKVLGDTLASHPADPLLLTLLAGTVVGVVCIFVAFVRVLVKRKRSTRAPSASVYLLPPEDAGDATVHEQTDQEVLERAFLATTAAAYELYARNAEEKRRLAAAQEWLILGAGLTLMFGALYTWKGSRPDFPGSGSGWPWEIVRGGDVDAGREAGLRFGAWARAGTDDGSPAGENPGGPGSGR